MCRLLTLDSSVSQLDNKWLSVFQLAIQENYRNNPFHNFRHCFCVSQMMYGMINLCNLQVCCELACVCVLIHVKEIIQVKCHLNIYLSRRQLLKSYSHIFRDCCSIKYQPVLFPVWTFSCNTSHLYYRSGEADSHRYGNSNDGSSVPWPGPPWIQQHVRLAILLVGVLTDRAMHAHWPQYVLTSSSQHCCQWTVKLVQCWDSSGMKTHWFRLSEPWASEDLPSYLWSPMGAWSKTSHSLVSPIHQVPNQCPHRAGSALQRHLPPGEPSLCCGLPDPVFSGVQYLCKRGSWGIQTDQAGETCVQVMRFTFANNQKDRVFLKTSRECLQLCSNTFQAIITLILATDMARHGEILDSFKQKVDNFDFTNEEHVTCVRIH